ncbi:MAG: hypothetical protein WCP21_13755 [Armatimonadota bacterium]
MKCRLVGMLGLFAVAAATVLSGCGGEAGFIAVPTETDEIAGHWVAVQQSTSLTGARVAVTVSGELSFVITQAGLKSWSGALTGTSGAVLDPATGVWLRTDKTYSLSNTAGQSGFFGWYGTELYSTTQVGAEVVYLWWTRQ